MIMAGLYIHIPFCAKKCAYCDFISFAGGGEEEEYINAVIKEMNGERPQNIETVFIGGGTPSYISSGGIIRLLDAANERFYIQKDAEITIEANPSSLSAEKLEAYKAAGINRLSIGLQSAMERELKMLGRLHDFNCFERVYNEAREKFDNINIDLISSLPGQSCGDFMYTLERAAGLRPEHISVYSLIINDNTPLGQRIRRGELEPVSEEEDRAIYHQTEKYLKNEGYARYEISNYVLAGRECRHNLNYWLGGDYIGLGCAAHSFMRGQRYHNSENLKDYIKAPQIKQEVQSLSLEDRRFECIMLELRLISGIERKRFKSRFGADIYELYTAVINQLIEGGFLELTPVSLKLTERGLDVADSVILKFMD